MNAAISNPIPSPEASGEGNANTARQNLRQNPFPRAPEGAREVTRPGVDAVVYVTSETTALGYSGRSKKPSWRYRFQSQDDRDKYIETFFTNVQRIQDRRVARRVERSAFKTALVAGDILYGTWGYEQTNVDFLQVLEVLASGRSVRVQPIESDIQERGSRGSMSGDATPIPNAFKDRPMLKRVLPGNRLSSEYCSLSKWDGRPVSCSWYA